MKKLNKIRQGKKLLTLFLCGMLTIPTLTACTAGSKLIFMGRLSGNEVFRIGSNVCTLPELKVYLTTAQKQYENILGVDMWERDFGGVTLESYLKETILGQIAQIKSMTLLAEEYGIELSEAEQKKVSEAAKKYYDSLNDAEKKYLEVEEETIADLYRDYALANKVYEEITQNVETEVSDDEARKITVQEILLKVNEEDTEEQKKEQYKKAKRILRQAKKDDANFLEIAEENSENEIIEYTFGKGEQEQEIEIAAFNLATDQISDIVETSSGYVIMKCVSNFDREQTDANKAEIVKKRKTEAFDDIYEEFISKQPSQLNDKLWESITFTDDDEINNMTFFEVYNEVFGV